MSKATAKNKPRTVSVLRMKRIRSGGTLVDMAKKIGISHPYVSMIERGYKIPQVLRDRVCRAYGVSEWQEVFSQALKKPKRPQQYVAVML